MDEVYVKQIDNNRIELKWIDGEITIIHDTENGIVTTVVKKGESFVGATNNWHDTKVTSASDAVAYVVFIGAKNLKNSINKD